MSVAVPTAADSASSERIEILDVLRGLALLGMLIVHFHTHSSEPGGIDDLIRTAIWRLIESKSHGMFALLFGAGFAIQLRRAEARGVPFADRYLRRLSVLALFGFAAHAFFGFNVLFGYAVWGVALLIVRRWSTPALLVTAAVSAASVGLFVLVTTTWQQWTIGADDLEAAVRVAVEVNDAVDRAEVQPHYGVLLAARLRHMAWFYQQPFFVMPGVTLTLFIAGFLLVRHRIFEEPGRHPGLLAALMLFGTASWALDNWLLPEDAPTFGLLRDQWLAFAYLGVVLQLLAVRPSLHDRPWLAAAGRMALTNYLLQIVVLDLLFSGYALGIGPLRPIVTLPLAIISFAIEMLISTWWLRRYHFGPAEWLWRSATHGKRQPLRRVPASVELAPL